MTRAFEAISAAVPSSRSLTSADGRLSSIFRAGVANPIANRSVGMVTTFAPTLCGIANFSRSLCEALVSERPETTYRIVRLSQDGAGGPASEVAYDLSTNGAGDNEAAARVLNRCDVVFLQHEFGIYGGDDGEQVVELLKWLSVPVIVVLHTVPADPSPGQRAVLDRLTRSADCMVTMSQTGLRRLLTIYQVPQRKVTLIPHGAPVVREPHRVNASRSRRPVVLTWGLLGPGKGIEWGIDALQYLRGIEPLPRYIVAGQTHPKVLAAQGESYRHSLVTRAAISGVEHIVEFEDGYLSDDRLLQLVRHADVVLLPYDSSEQITSGVLVEAIAAGVPVVSTAFPHAVELLAGDQGGLLVPHRDPHAMAAAVTRILCEPGLAAQMTAYNYGLSGQLRWPLVASQYGQLCDALLRQPSASTR